MALVVQKYGGTSIGDPERIKNVARRVLHTKNQGHQVVVVVSAMAGETDKLLRLAQQVTPNPDERELDVLVSTGEQVSIALLAISLKAMGPRAWNFWVLIPISAPMPNWPPSVNRVLALL